MVKSREAFRTISEVSDWLDTPAHVLRFWESRFNQIKPVKRAGGRRYYRPSDMLLLGGIRRLLHDDGITIKGVQKILREKGVNYVAGLALETLPVAGDANQPTARREVTPIEDIVEADLAGAGDAQADEAASGDTGSGAPSTDAGMADYFARKTRQPDDEDEDSDEAAGAVETPEAASVAVETAETDPVDVAVRRAAYRDDMGGVGEIDAAARRARIVALYERLQLLRDRVASAVD